MKTIILTTITFLAGGMFAQEEPKTPTLIGSPSVPPTATEKTVEQKSEDTTTFNLGKKKIIIVPNNGKESTVYDSTRTAIRQDIIEDSLENIKKERALIRKSKTSEPQWAGFDFGLTTLMNSDFKASFPTAKYWENDPVKSWHFNFNFAETQLNLGTPHFGITTGLGFNFTQIAFKEKYVLQQNDSMIFAAKDTIRNITKSKLRATYLTVPLLLQFSSKSLFNADDPFNEIKPVFFSVGVVGGVRLTSRTKLQWKDQEGRRTDFNKGAYDLNPFKLDAMVRMSRGALGVFVSYALLPVFDTNKTVAVHPLNFGFTVNF